MFVCFFLNRTIGIVISNVKHVCGTLPVTYFLWATRQLLLSTATCKVLPSTWLAHTLRTEGPTPSLTWLCCRRDNLSTAPRPMWGRDYIFIQGVFILPLPSVTSRAALGHLRELCSVKRQDGGGATVRGERKRQRKKRKGTRWEEVGSASALCWRDKVCVHSTSNWEPSRCWCHNPLADHICYLHSGAIGRHCASKKALFRRIQTAKTGMSIIMVHDDFFVVCFFFFLLSLIQI